MSEQQIPTAETSSQPANKINLSSIRLSQDFGAQAGATKLITHVPVGKPPKGQFFQVHPDSDYRLEVSIIKREGDEVYLLAQALSGLFPGLERPARLHLYATRHGSYGLWPVSLPLGDGKQNAWTQSALEIVEVAMSKWVRLVSNMAAGYYEAFEAKSLTLPPTWPEVTFNTLIDKAFTDGDRFVENEEHPLVQELLGSA